MTLPGGWVNLQDVSREGRVLMTYGKFRNRFAAGFPDGTVTPICPGSMPPRPRILRRWQATAVQRGERGRPDCRRTERHRRLVASAFGRRNSARPVARREIGLVYDDRRKQYFVLPTESGRNRGGCFGAAAEAGVEYLATAVVPGWPAACSRGASLGHRAQTFAVDVRSGQSEPLTPRATTATCSPPTEKRRVRETSNGVHTYSFELRKPARFRDRTR